MAHNMPGQHETNEQGRDLTIRHVEGLGKGGKGGFVTRGENFGETGQKHRYSLQATKFKISRRGDTVDGLLLRRLERGVPHGIFRDGR